MKNQSGIISKAWHGDGSNAAAWQRNGGDKSKAAAIIIVAIKHGVSGRRRISGSSSGHSGVAAWQQLAWRQ